MAWQTRAEARAQPFTALSGDQLDGILGAFDRRMRSISDDYLKKMGEHIAEIGTLIPSDVHRLQQLRRMRRNLRDIQRQIARAAGVSFGDVQKIFEHVATEDARMAARVMGRNPALVNDAPVKRILQAQLRETAGRLQNLSNTTVVSDAYRKAVDAGVSAVQSGVEDYGSAIRRTLREAGQMGLRVRDDGTTAVDYESGYSRRLDSAVRMNILDGVRHLNQSIMEEVGRQFGADGIEIDAHMLCAEDHLPYQGRQFSNADFEQIQSSLPRPFGEWNCRHSWHPILLGISQPAYTEAQLQEMRDYSTEEVTIDGRTKTRYEWSQEMRRCETAVRQQKDVATLAAAAGDDTLRRQCQGRIIALNDQYRNLANGAGLKPEFQRTNVQGFREEKAEDKKTPAAGNAAPAKAPAKFQQYTETEDDEKRRRLLAERDEEERKAFEADRSVRRLTGDERLTAISERDAHLARMLDIKRELRQYQFEATAQEAQKRGVDYLPLSKHGGQLTEDDIIARLAGGDKTSGSCASLSYCYIGQKAGYDVLDFRGGASCDLIASNNKSMLDSLHESGYDSIQGVARNYKTAGKRALKQAEIGKEYMFSCGRHAAIVRRTGADAYEYLELQSGYSNGWKPFGTAEMDYTLKKRFGADIGGFGDDVKATLVSVDEMAKSDRVLKILGYINTPEGMQRKGIGGHER